MNSNKIKHKSKANKLELKKNIVILNSMVVRNIKNQYRRSYLGILWTILNPLLTMIVMAFVFSEIFGRNVIGMDYPIYVLTGNIVFSLMRMSTTASLPCLVDNYDLMSKTRVPYSVFPTSHTFSAVVNFGFSMIALIFVMLIRMRNGVQFHWTMFFVIIPWLPAITLFCLGISFALSAIYVRFRDIKHIYSVVLTLWMYLTPIFYATTVLSTKVQSVLRFNPMYHYLLYFREVVALGTVPSLELNLICYGFGILSFLGGLLLFRLSRKKIILYI